MAPLALVIVGATGAGKNPQPASKLILLVKEAKPAPARATVLINKENSSKGYDV